MNTKSSKKIVPATVFAAIIVLSAFAVMCTTVSALTTLNKTLTPDDGGLGDVVNVTIEVNVTAEDGAVTVVDTLPPELTYKDETFTVNGTTATPTVDKQEISYAIADPGLYTIEFDVKVTEAYWEDRNVSNEVAVYNETDYEIDNATANFTINAFTDLYKRVVEGNLTNITKGEKAEWKIEMGVNNTFPYIMNDTNIADRFGGDLMIDSINTTEGNYTFNYTNYTKKRATVNISKDGMSWDVPLNKTGVTIGELPYEFHIFWTGKTHKAHFAWTIGDLGIGNSTNITIGVSTDINTGTGNDKKPGHQEYTSTGNHTLNSGATLKFIDLDQDMQLSAVTDSIVVTVLPE